MQRYAPYATICNILQCYSTVCNDMHQYATKATKQLDATKATMYDALIHPFATNNLHKCFIFVTAQSYVLSSNYGVLEARLF